MMKKIPVDQAVGMILAHDMTEIIPGEKKHQAFKKGHVIQEDDLEILKNMGKNHIFVMELSDEEYHENDGAMIFGQGVSGDNIEIRGPVEGKVELYSKVKGRLNIDLDLLLKANEEDGLILATRHRDIVVGPGEKVAGAKIIPLTIEKKVVDRIVAKMEKRGKIIDVEPFLPLKVGILVTGSEVYYGRIEDAFIPRLSLKVDMYGGQVVTTGLAPDETREIEKEISRMIDEGCELILVSGGMSVDPDDLTPAAIGRVADEIITYGSPILPGAMFMMAYKNHIPIMGIPAGGLFSKVTALDLMLPFVFTGKKITKRMILKKAHGGLCTQCNPCTYPHCEFGKG